MAFFIQDFHRDTVAFHETQSAEYTYKNLFIVFRGQDLSQSDLKQLNKAQRKLLPFYNGLSISTDREVSFDFIRQMIKTSDLVGISFVMRVNPLIASTSFADLHSIIYYKEKQYFLLSMHSAFRTNQIQQLNNARLSKSIAFSPMRMISNSTLCSNRKHARGNFSHLDG